MKKLLLLMVCCFALFACDDKDDNEVKECEKNNIGYLKVTNKTNSTIEVHVDNSLLDILTEKETSKQFTLSPKDYNILVIQTSTGKTLYNSKTSIKQCETIDLSYSK